MPNDPVLCYVSGQWAYFTTRPLNQQWGDDWNDVPYEHNAGTPYSYSATDGMVGKDPWRIVAVAFDGDLQTPSQLSDRGNSQYSVEMINAGIVPWLSFDRFSNHKVTIKAGETLIDFCKLVARAGGNVYLASTPPTVDDAVALLKTLRESERMSVFNNFCIECGDADPTCQCWNDD